MRKRFFFNNLIHTLCLTILPILLLSIAHFLLSSRDLRNNTNRESLDKLLLIQEEISLMFQDSTKVLKFLENPSLVNSIKKTFLKSNMNYDEYLTYKHVVQHLQAFVKSADYIDSIYVYLPNDQGLYLTSNANIYSYFKMPDQNWLPICEAASSRFIRRNAHLYAALPDFTDYLTVIEKSGNRILVAINIKVSHFKKVLGNLNLATDQTILITNHENELLLSSGDSADGKAQLGQIVKTAPDRNWTSYNTSDMLIVRSQSEPLGLNFISVTPNKVAYRYLERFIGLSLLAGAACLLLCIIFSAIYASRTTKQVYFIIELLDAATRNQTLPTNPNKRQDDIYSYIVSNIVQTFIQNDYLKTMLNERKFHAISLELSALQYQINPHFLSNTLQTIDFEIMRLTNGPSKANQMIEQLSEFLQYSLRSPKQDVSIIEEIEATKIYINLMQERYPNRFEVKWELDNTILSLPIPKLILQPMIENSIQQCMRITERPGLLQIRIYQEDGALIISIRDNGPGVSPERLQEIRHSLSHFEGFNQKHIGLQNLFRRLQLRFKMKCRIQLESLLNHGFSVTLLIPIAEIYDLRQQQAVSNNA